MKHYAVVAALSLLFSSTECTLCYKCESTCLTSPSTSLQEKIDKFESKEKICHHNCINPNNSTDVDNCGPSKACFSVLGLLSRNDHDGNNILTTHIKRGCIPRCPKQKVCDLKKVKECGFSPKMTDLLRTKLGRGAAHLNNLIDKNFEIKVDLGTGGELQCCDEDKCNVHTETKLAHHYIKDEL